MSNDKYLITFVGSSDLMEERAGNAAIEQCIREFKPKKIFIFLTPAFTEGFYDSGLYKRISDIFTAEDIHIEKTHISVPVDIDGIYREIKGPLKEIQEQINKEKAWGLVNIASGTPAMASVFSLLIGSGRLSRFYTVYAPNPQYANKAYIANMKLYRSNFDISILKRLIENYNFKVILEFLQDSKCPLTELKENSDFDVLVKFCQYRFCADYDKATSVYKESSYLKEEFPNWEKPVTFSKLIVERFCAMSILDKVNDNVQRVLWLGIIREMAVKELIVKFQVPGITKMETEEKRVTFLPDIPKNDNEKAYGLSTRREFDVLTDFLKTLNSSDAERIKKALNALGELVKHRDYAAHTTKMIIYKPEWRKNVSILVRYLNGGKDPELFYERAKDELLRMCKEAV